jgi:hypothetical protein
MNQDARQSPDGSRVYRLDTRPTQRPATLLAPRLFELGAWMGRHQAFGFDLQQMFRRRRAVRTFVYPARFERGEKPGVLVVTMSPRQSRRGTGRRTQSGRRRIAAGREIPKTSKATRGERPIPVPAPMSAKAALYLALREAGMTNVQLARKLGCDEREVRRMLDPRRPTKVPRLNEALGCVSMNLPNRRTQ